MLADSRKDFNLYCMFSMIPFLFEALTVEGFSVKALSDPVQIGGDAKVECKTTVEQGESLRHIAVVLGKEQIASARYSPRQVIKDSSKIDKRFRFDSKTHTLTIANTTCTDQKRVSCYATFLGVTAILFKLTSTTQLKVKVPPRVPESLTTDPDLADYVEEGSPLTAKCVANVGQRTSGKIVWKIGREAKSLEVIHESDARVSMHALSLTEGEPPCSAKLESVLKLDSLGRKYEDAVLTCFAHNVAYKTKIATATCTAQAFCLQSPTVRFRGDHIKSILLLVGIVALLLLVLVVYFLVFRRKDEIPPTEVDRVTEAGLEEIYWL